MSNVSSTHVDYYALLKITQRKQGMGRMKLGALLYLLKESGSWQGRGGNSFRQFIVEHGLEPRAAQQYMKVAKCFVIDFHLQAPQLEKIASASVRNLVFASTIATPNNIENIIDILSSLPRPEAYEELSKIAPRIGTRPAPSQVNKILDQLGNLTLDERAEFYQKIGAKHRTHSIVNTM